MFSKCAQEPKKEVASKIMNNILIYQILSKKVIDYYGKRTEQDFESNCVSKEKAVFKMVAEEGFEPPTFGL